MSAVGDKDKKKEDTETSALPLYAIASDGYCAGAEPSSP